MEEIRVILKPNRERAVEARHPWIYSGAVDLIDEGFTPGDIVRVYSDREEFLGKGYLDPQEDIAIRMLTFQDEAIDEAFFTRRLGDALRLREMFLPPRTNAYRLVNSEGDFLPGLVVDRYGDCLVAQVLTSGMERFKSSWVSALRSVMGSQDIKGIYERSEAVVRGEIAESVVQVLSGEEVPDWIGVEECGVKFVVDIRKGQKTGFFLDQRENRRKVAALAKGKRVLNAFSYTGAFSVCAALGGAREVVSIEASETALNTSQHNFEINGLDPHRYQFVREDVFEFLRRTKEAYDLIVLDPPAFAKAKNQVNQASRGYKDINLWAMRSVVPGGLLFTASCSSYISMDLFQKIVFAAAKDARRSLQMVEKSAHPWDHPVSIYHPEGEYLKGIWCRVLPL